MISCLAIFTVLPSKQPIQRAFHPARVEFCDVSVQHGRFDIGVAQQVLDVPQIGAGLAGFKKPADMRSVEPAPPYKCLSTASATFSSTISTVTRFIPSLYSMDGT